MGIRGEVSIIRQAGKHLKWLRRNARCMGNNQKEAEGSGPSQTSDKTGIPDTRWNKSRGWNPSREGDSRLRKNRQVRREEMCRVLSAYVLAIQFRRDRAH